MGRRGLIRACTTHHEWITYPLIQSGPASGRSDGKEEKMNKGKKSKKKREKGVGKLWVSVYHTGGESEKYILDLIRRKCVC